MILGHGDDSYRYEDIRINFSSNIYAHADLSALKQYLSTQMDVIGRYPEPDACSLEAAIASRWGIGKDCVLVTSGATEAIYLIAQAFGLEKKTYTASFIHPTFCEYEDACRMYGIETTDMSHGAILWLCNPNNPNGCVFSIAEIWKLADKFDYVITDQSYEEYTLAPMLTHQDAATSRNILQLHSLTKTYAVPGLRIGYITAPPHIIAWLRHYVRPWAVNALAIEAGKWLIENNVRALPALDVYLAETERLRQRLNEIPGIKAAETHTNFFVAQVSSMTAAELKCRLAERYHILIRDASNFKGLTTHHFRVSTQSPQENDQLISAISDIMRH